MTQVPEHTWGFDTKTFLHDNANWANKQFHAQLDAHAHNYEDNIAQWQRQRGYMTWAMEALDLSRPHVAEPLSKAESLSHDSWHDSSHDSAHAADSTAGTLRTGERRKLTARRTAESARSSAAGLNLPELSLRQELEQLRSELQRQHELTDVEGYKEHPIGEPLKLKSSFWDIEVNTTTGMLTPKGSSLLYVLSVLLLHATTMTPPNSVSKRSHLQLALGLCLCITNALLLWCPTFYIPNPNNRLLFL